MNIQAMMKQAQKLQSDMLNEKQQLDKELFPGKYNFIELEMNGKKEIVKFKIDKEVFNSDEDLEMLEDMITVAVNETIKKINVETDKRMSKYGSGLSGLL